MKRSQLKQLIKEEIHKVLEAMAVDPQGNLVPDENISSILKQLVIQGLGDFIGYDEDEDENEWISDWNWDEKKYRLLSNGINFIVFLDNDPKILHELYMDAEDWHPSPYKFQDSFVENYFILGVQDAYKDNMERLNTMMNTGYTGTIDNLVMAKINNKNQLLYFFNI